jgi:hypothetical protein
MKPSFGKLLAHASWAFPLLGFAFIAVRLASDREEASTATLATYVGALLAGVLCAVVALAGMFRWGHRDIWLFAVFGLALSLFLLGMLYTGYIEHNAFIPTPPATSSNPPGHLSAHREQPNPPTR